MKSIRFLGGLLASCMITTVCLSQNSSTPSTTSKQLNAIGESKLVYVSDFELDVEKFTADEGRSMLPPPPPGLPSLRKQEDPAKRAHELVDLMSTTLVANLQKAGFTAQRLLPGQARPKEGLLLQGIFAELDEGSRMRRAMIGFGSGASTMQIYVTLSDLAHSELPLYQVTDKSNSGKKPGTVITLNPYVGAVKFMMTKNAPDKMVKKTASQITTEIAKRLNNAESSSTMGKSERAS